MNKVKKISGIFTDAAAIKSILFDAFLIVTILVAYCTAGFFANKRYLEWAETLDNIPAVRNLSDPYFKATNYRSNVPRNETNPLKQPLQDVFLDYIIPLSWNQENAIQYIADVIPYLCLAIGLISCLVQRYMDLSNHMFMMLAFLFIANGIVENITVMPSSYGYERCVDFLKLRQKFSNGTADTPFSKHYSFTVSFTGTCTQMMWSGHTQQTMIGTYTAFSVLERRWPRVFLRKTGSKYTSVSLKTFVVYTMAFVVAVLLMVNRGHYSSDIWVGFLVTSLVLSNDKIKYWGALFNPFLKHHKVYVTRLEKAVKLEAVTNLLELEFPDAYAEVKERILSPHHDVKGGLKPSSANHHVSEDLEDLEDRE